MAREVRTNRKAELGPGLFVGIVVNHLDPKLMGGLEVDLMKKTTAGNVPEASGQIVPVRYASPFYGVTPFKGLTENEGYAYTQKSYGMWFVPPDVGTKVLCMFSEGNAGEGYWFACVPEEFMNFMMPGYPSTNYNDLDQEQSIPVGEYNKKLETGAGRIANKFIKPHNPYQWNSLQTRGLKNDFIRGKTTSSARREAPSMVFGISTPGPADRTDGSPRVKYGNSFGQSDVAFNRLGGSSFVMDDGDATLLRKGLAGTSGVEYVNIENGEEGGDPTVPFNEHIRIQTRTGHQILLHNAEDLIYIGNSRGTAWLEITSNGKIDIYARDSISVKSDTDINLSADRDINLAAARNFNVTATNNGNITAMQNFNFIAGAEGKMEVGADFDLFVGGSSKHFAGGGLDIKVTGDGKLTVSGALDAKAGTNTKITQGGTLDINTTGATNITGATIDLNPASPAATAADAAQAKTAEFANFPKRTPAAEPWLGHENLNPENFTPEKTEALANPAESRRQPNGQISSERDQPATTTQWRDQANTRYTTDANGNRVETPQVVVGGQAETYGSPRQTVPINDMQRFFLGQLVAKQGLTYNVSASEGGNAEAIAMAMAQPQAECGFEPRSENMNYRASRLRAVYPSRVRSDAFAQQLVAAGPAAIGNTLYGNRYGNAQDEGYKYRGRGLIQLTFKDNYKRYGKLAGHPNIVDEPDLANDPEIACDLAVAYITSKSVSWSSSSLSDLGEEFRKAVGYANQGGKETSRRIGIAKGFLAKLLSGELTPLSAINPEPVGEGEQAEAPTPPPDTFKTSGPR